MMRKFHCTNHRFAMEVLDLRNLDEDFQNYFPRLSFTLTDFQKKVIYNVSDKGNTLCILPTGGGKSVIYWMSTLELNGTAIVISPLTALILEQAGKIEEQGYEVLAIHGGVSVTKQMKLLSDFANKKSNPKFIFLSPEKIATDGFLEYCLKCRRDNIKLIVIDEVHCVSQWGMNFRPFYLRIPDFMNQLFGKNQWSRILALTATLNPKEIADICRYFRIEKENIIMNNILMRSGIQLHVSKFLDEEEKTKKFWNIIHNHQDEKILVYVYRKYKKHSVEALCAEAEQRGYKAVAFHGDMDSDERMKIIGEYKDNKYNIVFATNAFGMGIDIPDIRVVIHFMIPESVEQYYQEVGRAARDGHGANAYLLYSDKNIQVKKQYFIDKSFPSEDKIRKVFTEKIGTKQGYQTLAYFDDEEVQQCIPYFIEEGLIDIVCKGFADLKNLTEITDQRLQKLYDSTKNKGYIRTVNQSAKDEPITPKELSELVYSCVLSGKAQLLKPLERWLIIKVNSTHLSDGNMKHILDMIDEKKQYKHDLLNYFVYLIETNTNTQELHQEIAAYLGTEKHSLNKIYKTEDGTMVRSKSEVIISNLLHKAKLRYEYEEKLFYEPGKWIEPDFTIYKADGSKAYWEHVGMLGKEDYDLNWAKKIDIYNKYFPGMMVKTYETGVLSDDAKAIIDNMI